MADVYAGVGAILARAKDIELEPELDEIAAEILSFAIGLAAAHVETTDYAQSLQITVDRTSPSRRDRFVYSDDPGAASIEWGHVSHVGKGRNGPGRWVEGQFILTRAMDAVHERS